jgi:transcription initiation factor IIE alpha subunit
MPRREWSRPFGEIKAQIMAVLQERTNTTSDEIVQATGLPFEDVISALRMLRHSGEIDFDPEWESEGVMRAAHNVRLRA